MQIRRGWWSIGAKGWERSAYKEVFASAFSWAAFHISYIFSKRAGTRGDHPSGWPCNRDIQAPSDLLNNINYGRMARSRNSCARNMYVCVIRSWLVPGIPASTYGIGREGQRYEATAETAHKFASLMRYSHKKCSPARLVSCEVHYFINFKDHLHNVFTFIRSICQ